MNPISLTWPEFDRFRSKLAEVWPNVRPILGEVVKSWPNYGWARRCRERLPGSHPRDSEPKLARARPRLTGVGPARAKSRPTLANLGQGCPEVRPPSAEIVRIWAKVGLSPDHIWPAVRQHRPDLVELGQSLPRSASVRRWTPQAASEQLWSMAKFAARVTFRTGAEKQLPGDGSRSLCRAIGLSRAARHLSAGRPGAGAPAMRAGPPGRRTLAKGTGPPTPSSAQAPRSPPGGGHQRRGTAHGDVLGIAPPSASASDVA